MAPISGTATAHAGSGTVFAGNFTNSAGTRHYEGYVPSTYRPATPIPLVVALHGCTETAGTFRQLSHLDNLAEAKGFIVVYPEQLNSSNPMGCWNWFLDKDKQRGQGEPSIIAGITQSLTGHYSVDPNRVYLLGFSAGGAMADVMGATYPDLYAAIGIGSGIQYGGINPTMSPTQAGRDVYAAMGSHAREMPVLIFQGGQDGIVPPSDATDLVRQWQTTDNLVVPGEVPGLPTQSEALISPGSQAYTVDHYRNDHGQDVLQSWLVPSMPHAWSGGCGCQPYADPSGPDESAAIYDFFINHPMATSAWTVYGGGLFGGLPGWPAAGAAPMPTPPAGIWPFPTGTVDTWPRPTSPGTATWSRD